MKQRDVFEENPDSMFTGRQVLTLLRTVDECRRVAKDATSEEAEKEKTEKEVEPKKRKTDRKIDSQFYLLYTVFLLHVIEFSVVSLLIFCISLLIFC